MNIDTGDMHDIRELDDHSTLVLLHESIIDTVEGTLMAMTFNRFTELVGSYQPEIFNPYERGSNCPNFYVGFGFAFTMYMQSLSERELLDYCVETINHNACAIYKDYVVLERYITADELADNGFIDALQEEIEHTKQQQKVFSGGVLLLSNIILKHTRREGNELAYDQINVLELIMQHGVIDKNYFLPYDSTFELVTSNIDSIRLGYINNDNFEETIIDIMCSVDTHSLVEHFIRGFERVLNNRPSLMEENMLPFAVTVSHTPALHDVVSKYQNNTDLRRVLFTHEGSAEMVKEIIKAVREKHILTL